MKKRVILFLILILSLIIILPLILAQDDEDDNEVIANEGDEINQAYSCLKTKLGTNCGNTNSIESLSFSLLAMGYDSNIQEDCKTALINKQSSDHWGDKDIKSTAQAILALNYISENVNKPVEWLLSREKPTKGLNWFLQIDSINETECEISRNNRSSNDFDINENKKVSGSSSCLSPASLEQNYYFEIDDDCLDDTFTISCDEAFITSIFYKKLGSSIYYISSETHGASAGGETKEKVNSYCFAKSSSSDCNYEASLWAALALAKVGEDVSIYLPYLSTEADEVENKKYLPFAFLYMLTNEDDYYIDLAGQKTQDKYWKEGNEYYDTSLALLALQDVSIDETEKAKEWLFDVQENSGCWHSGNILDTAFILYSGWPKDPVISAGSSYQDCEDSGGYCVSSGECSLANTNNNYCASLSDVCCETKPVLESCNKKGGIICESDQSCSIPEILDSNNEYCCLGDCNLIETINECESNDYSCEDKCSSNQDEKIAYSGSCNFNEVCCGEKPDEPGSLWLIILLIVLIVLVILAIIFRNQLKIWFFKIKSKFKSGKGPKQTRRPSIPPPGGIPRFGGRPRQVIPRQPIRRMPVRRVPRRVPPKDTVFDDTMKKLREMTK